MEKVYKSKRKTWARFVEIMKDQWNGEEMGVTAIGYFGMLWLLFGILFHHTLFGTIAMSIGAVFMLRDIYIKVKPLFNSKK